MPRIKKGVPWLDQRDGVFYACWYDDRERRTKRLSLRTRDADEAKGRFSAFLTEGPGLIGTARGPDVLTVAQVLDFYDTEHVGPNVRDKQRLRDEMKHLRAFFTDTAVTDLGIPLARAYAAARLGGKLVTLTKHGKQRSVAPATVRKELSTLLAAIRHSVAWKRLTPDMVPTLERPSAPRTRGVWLTPEELHRLRAAAVNMRGEDSKRLQWTDAGWRAWAFIEIAYFTAARRRSVEALQWFQVDLERGRINFAKPNDPETKKRKAIVPIDPALMPTLKELKAAATTSWVLGHNGSIKGAFDAACRRAGLVKLPASDTRPAGTVTPHVLRHSRATHLLQQGKAPWAVANLLGDNLQTVLRTYGHHCPNYLADLFEAPKPSLDFME